jgi:lysozyme family protein
VRGDEIQSQAVAESIFDTAVNMGAKSASRLVQEALGIPKPDGIIGPKSLEAINGQPEQLFLAEFTLGKIGRYVAICGKDKTQERFLLGWIRRALEA